MARITRVELSVEYRSARKDGVALGECGSDCAVVALSAATGVTYAEAHAALAAAGRKTNEGTRQVEQDKALAALGFKGEWVSQTTIINLYPGAHASLKHVTTHHPDRFAKYWPAGTFWLYTTRHVLCVKDGTNHDWTRGSSKRVRKILRIVKL